MFAYAQIALAVLQLVNSGLTWLRERGLIEAGVDKAIAQESAAILAKTHFAKAVMEDITSLNATQTDDLLKRLEN